MLLKSNLNPRLVNITTRALLVLSMGMTILTILIFYVPISNNLRDGLVAASTYSYPGYCFVAALCLLTFWKFPDIITIDARKMLRWSFTILLGCYFFMVAFGKMRHFEEMLEFFTSSGLSIVLLYAVIVSEIIAAAGLFLHHFLKTGPLAVTIMIIITTGAIGTPVFRIVIENLSIR